MSEFNTEVEEEEEVITGTCSYCAEAVSQEELDDNCGMCASCYEEHTCCEHCDSLVHVDDTTTVNFSSRHSTCTYEACVCNDCAKRHYETCRDCDGYYRRDDMTQFQDAYICSHCIDDYYFCQGCNELVHAEDVCWSDNVSYCSECVPNPKSNLIESYGYKPTPRFNLIDPLTKETICADSWDVKYDARYSSFKEFYGIELETDGAIPTDEVINELDTIFNLNQMGQNVYYKEDGSLDKGFEMVTHPATYEYHMSKIAYKEAFNHLIRNGFRSHDANTCGLHIHISRTAFGEDENQQMYHISRFMYLVEKFYTEIFKLTRRSQDQMDRWAQRYGLEPIDKPEDMLKKANGKSRYYILNFQNSQTVEMRAFRGTLNVDTFYATLQLVKSLRDLACTKTDLIKLNWDGFKKFVKAKDFQYLLTYMEQKLK